MRMDVDGELRINMSVPTGVRETEMITPTKDPKTANLGPASDPEMIKPVAAKDPVLTKSHQISTTGIVALAILIIKDRELTVPAPDYIRVLLSIDLTKLQGAASENQLQYLSDILLDTVDKFSVFRWKLIRCCATKCCYHIRNSVTYGAYLVQNK